MDSNFFILVHGPHTCIAKCNNSLICRDDSESDVVKLRDMKLVMNSNDLLTRYGYSITNDIYFSYCDILVGFCKLNHPFYCVRIDKFCNYV